MFPRLQDFIGSIPIRRWSLYRDNIGMLISKWYQNGIYNTALLIAKWNIYLMSNARRRFVKGIPSPRPQNCSDLYQSDTGAILRQHRNANMEITSRWHICFGFADVEIICLSAVEQNRWRIAGNSFVGFDETLCSKATCLMAFVYIWCFQGRVPLREFIWVSFCCHKVIM